MTQNPSIQGLFGVVIFMWLVTFGFLVLAATWMLLRPQNTKWKKGLGINIEEL